jgi:hypothetical protein
MRPRSFEALAVEGTGSQTAWISDQHGDILPEKWMDIENV